MRFENEDYGERISKQNRRTSQARRVEREVHHMFKRVVHTLDRNSLEERAHKRERKAMKKSQQ